MPAASSIKVMVVDDQASMRAMIRRALQDLGFKDVRDVGAASEALSTIRTDRVHLIISDYNMPEIDGLQFLELVRNDPVIGKTVFIMLTGSSDREVVQKAAALGVNNYLVKPFAPAALKEKIERVFGLCPDMRRIPIIQGEHAVVAEPNVMISTLLGSCIAVCLQDPVGHIGGMNHFLLGEPGRDQKVSGLEMQRYGVHAMELLINAMMAKGASRANLRAQVYGGANIIAGLGSIGSSNADFARRFLATEGITVGHVDTGGKSARKVEFLPFDGRARCTTVSEARIPPIVKPLPVVDGEVELF